MKHGPNLSHVGALREKGMLAAIKVHRERTGARLTDSKEEVEQFIAGSKR